MTSTSKRDYLDRRQGVVIEAQAKVVKDYKELYQSYMKPTWNPSVRFLKLGPRCLLDENGEKMYDRDGEEMKDPETNAFEIKSELWYFPKSKLTGWVS